MTDKKRRILLKLSGEALGGGDWGIDYASVSRMTEQIVKASKENVEIAVVLGGGNFLRGSELAQEGVVRARADYMGMLATVINSLAVQESIEQHNGIARVQTSISMRQVAEQYIPLRAIRHLEKGRVVIFGGGTGLPYFSTDTVAVQRTLEIGCDEILMAKSGVDGVYSSDPKKDKGAKFFDKITYTEALVQDLKIMDAAALSLARDNNIPMRVFGIEGEDNIYKAIIGEEIGTKITTK